MAGLRDATQVGQRQRSQSTTQRRVGILDVAIGVMSGIAAGTAGVVTPFGLALGAAAVTSFSAAGTRFEKASRLAAKATALDALVRGQTQMGALYGRAPAGSGASLDLMRGAAARTAGEMGKTSTMGAGGGAAPAAGQQSDGQTEGYTRLRNGRTETVRGYSTPSR